MRALWRRALGPFKEFGLAAWTLYALDRAKRPIIQAGFALVVEGYTDVLSLHDAGIAQAVATCGTALRADHFKLLADFEARFPGGPPSLIGCDEFIVRGDVRF